MLALGASHCSLINPSENKYTVAAITHRGKAVRGLSAILSQEDCNVIDMDSALATCNALILQAHYMSDGVTDFAILMRGCGLVTGWCIRQKKRSRTFTIQAREEKSAMITSWLPSRLQPLHDEKTIRACITSLDRLHPFLQSPAHQAFHQALHQTYEAFRISQRHAITKIINLYAVWAAMDNTEFLTFISVENQPHLTRLDHSIYRHRRTHGTCLR